MVIKLPLPSDHARVLLAALDHNHHLIREYVQGSDGPRQRRVYRKRTKRWDTIPVKQAKNYSYIGELLMTVLAERGKSN